MEGTIKITGSGYGNVNFELDTENVSWMDKMMIFDAMTIVLELSEEERREVATIIAAGGIGALTGKTPTVVRIDGELIEQLKQKGKQEEE